MSIITPPGIAAKDLRPLLPRDFVAVSMRQKVIPDWTGDITTGTTNSMNSAAIHYAPALSDITDLTMVFPGWGFNIGETNLPNVDPFTVECQIEYPLGTTPQRLVTPIGGNVLTVTPGYTYFNFEPSGITIKAGTAFRVKCFMNWTATTHFVLSGYVASLLTNEWSNFGASQSNFSGNLTPLTSNSPGGGYSGLVYGRLASNIPSLAIIGDSISVGAGYDTPDPTTGVMFLERALRGQIPVVNYSRAQGTVSGYLARTFGRNQLTRKSVSHLIFSMMANDIYGTGVTLTQAQNLLQSAIGPYLARGIKVFCVTVTPRTTSTDHWVATVNQTISNTATNAVRLAYNAWLRSNWQSLGITGIFDWAHILDPNDTSLWPVDGTAGFNARGFATLTGTSVSAVSLGAFQTAAGAYTPPGQGIGYPISSSVACVVTPYPGDPGAGAVVTMQVNGSGVATGFTVVSGGSGYLYPPMVSPRGEWCNDDGIHPTCRGFDQLVAQSGLAPGLFV